MRDLGRAALSALPRLPGWVNRPLMALNRDPARVYGRRYAAYREMLRATGGDAPDGEARLLASVNAALASVPYYRRRYGSRPVGSMEEFRRRIGFVDKDAVMADEASFLSEAVDLERYEAVTTGGTSGRPLRILAPRDRYVVETATMHALWERAGYRFDVRAVIRNHRLEEGERWRIDPVTREVIFDGFRLDDEHFREIHATIRRLGIRFVHCYPSTAYEFAASMERQGLDPGGITAFLSGSENVFPYQRQLIQERLGVRFYNWYGHSEKLVLAGYCRGTDLYHVEPTYGFFELVDDEGRVVTEPGGAGEIVGTSFHNPGMPLLRYRTGDRAVLAGNHCPACGRHIPLLEEIRGRWSGDRIYHADGTFVTTTALNLHSDLYSVLHGFQYVQEAPGELTVLIVPSPGFTGDHERALLAHFTGRLKPGTRVGIRKVERLLRKPNGKFVHLMSSVVPDPASPPPSSA